MALLPYYLHENRNIYYHFLSKNVLTKNVYHYNYYHENSIVSNEIKPLQNNNETWRHRFSYNNQIYSNRKSHILLFANGPELCRQYLIR